MDDLAGYGSSDSDSNKEEKPSIAAVGALSGLLADYSDDDDDKPIKNNDDGRKNVNGVKGGDNSGRNGERMSEPSSLSKNPSHGPPTMKRRRRWDNPNFGDTADANYTSALPNIDDVLPPPRLLNDASLTSLPDTREKDNKGGDDPFQSLTLFRKDYTEQLRQSLSRQLQSQSMTTQTSKEMQLSKKLEQMFVTFHQDQAVSVESNVPHNASSSFAAHLKSKREFGNPHLLRNIIDHFQIDPLESHTGNLFRGFEYVERLVVAEEKSRIAAANYEVGISGGGSDSARGMVSGAT